MDNDIRRMMVNSIIRRAFEVRDMTGFNMLGFKIPVDGDEMLIETPMITEDGVSINKYKDLLDYKESILPKICEHDLVPLDELTIYPRDNTMFPYGIRINFIKSED